MTGKIPNFPKAKLNSAIHKQLNRAKIKQKKVLSLVCILITGYRYSLQTTDTVQGLVELTNYKNQYERHNSAYTCIFFLLSFHRPCGLISLRLDFR